MESEACNCVVNYLFNLDFDVVDCSGFALPMNEKYIETNVSMMHHYVVHMFDCIPGNSMSSHLMRLMLLAGLLIVQIARLI